MSEIASNEKFPKSFWMANVTELFERGAYYAMASFVVVYLGQIGLGNYWPSTLNSILWFLVYFLPILSGTIADHVGFKRSLLAAFVLLGIGYFAMGYPVWLGGAEMKEVFADEVTAGLDVILPAMMGIILIGIGGSVIKPCISGTVQKTAGARATLGFGIFYMVINVGSVVGRLTAYFFRRDLDLSYIYAVSVVCCIIAFFVVLFFYKDPEKELKEKLLAEGKQQEDSEPAKPKKSVGKILSDMVLVLKNGRFVTFLMVCSGFWFVYSQVYNVVPLYLKKVVELDPPIELYTLANPIVIVCFQLLITTKFGKMKPIKSMVVGGVIIGSAMALNVIPLLLSGNVQKIINVGFLLPFGAVYAILTVAMIAFGELFAAARQFEYIGQLAPKGQEGLFLGYANLPMAIGSLAGGPIGAVIFNEIMCKGAEKLPSGLLKLQPFWNGLGWIILMSVGIISAILMLLYNRWLEKQPN